MGHKSINSRYLKPPLYRIFIRTYIYIYIYIYYIYIYNEIITTKNPKKVGSLGSRQVGPESQASNLIPQILNSNLPRPQPYVAGGALQRPRVFGQTGWCGWFPNQIGVRCKSHVFLKAKLIKITLLLASAGKSEAQSQHDRRDVRY